MKVFGMRLRLHYFLLPILVFTVVAPANAQGTSIDLHALYHNTYDSLYRFPYGAVPTNSNVVLRLRTAANNAESVDLRLYNSAEENESLIPMNIAATTPDGFDIWEAQIETGRQTTVYYYRFIVRTGDEIAYYEDDNTFNGTFIPALEGGEGGATTSSADLSYQISVYDPEFYTPEWMRNAVVYQIFPDRFRNGDVSNDPTDNSELFYNELPLYFHEIWNEPPIDGRTTQAPNSSTGYFNSDFYGGDLAGIIDKLDYLQDLGITAIYLNPIFEARSNHRYDTVNYLAIDPMLGSQEEFLTLITEARARNMHIILDGVFNHLSSDSTYFDRYNRFETNGACESIDSEWRSWFIFKAPRGAQPNACVENPDGLTSYESWAGFDTIPKLDSALIDVRRFIFLDQDSVIQTWGNLGIGGWRLDVAGDIDNGRNPLELYWEAFRTVVRRINPEAVIIGEEWNDAAEWLLGDEWDSVMNYRLRRGILGFVRNSPFIDNDGGNQAVSPLTPYEFDSVIHAIEADYPPQAYYALMNLLGSHDTTRAFFALDNDTQALKLAALTQFALPGAPTIYYGDEIALDAPSIPDSGGVLQDDPFNRAPYPWDDTEGNYYPDPNEDVLSYYQFLAAARHANSALRGGEMITLLAEENRGLYIFARIDRATGNTVLVALNNSNEERGLDLQLAGTLPTGMTLTPLFGEGALTVTETPVRIAIQPLSGNLWASEIQDGTAYATLQAPLNIEAEASTGQVSLTWDAVENADSYIVYRSPVAIGGYVPTGENISENQYIDTEVDNGFGYYYQIVPVGPNGLSGTYSDAVYAVPSASIDSLYYVGDDENTPQPDTYSPIVLPLTVGTQTTLSAAIRIDGITDTEGAGAGIQAQAALIPATVPVDHAQWTPMAYVSELEEADVYEAQINPQQSGKYQLAARFSTDAGQTWTVVQLRDGTLPQLIVEVPNDTVAPAAPENIRIDRISMSGVALSWDTVVDESLFGYRIYRQTTDEMELIGQVMVGEPPAFLDNAVAQGTTYRYAVTAIDGALNESAETMSETVTVERQIIPVTFIVRVPESTGSDEVYIAGNFGSSDYPTWDPAGIVMEQIDGTHWSVTLNLPEAANIEYKFVRGTWDAVEKGADCEEISNRTLTVVMEDNGALLADDHEVLKWRDLDMCG